VEPVAGGSISRSLILIFVTSGADLSALGAFATRIYALNGLLSVQHLCCLSARYTASGGTRRRRGLGDGEILALIVRMSIRPLQPAGRTVSWGWQHAHPRQVEVISVASALPPTQVVAALVT
jgi:hypothetical protein